MGRYGNAALREAPHRRGLASRRRAGVQRRHDLRAFADRSGDRRRQSLRCASTSRFLKMTTSCSHWLCLRFDSSCPLKSPIIARATYPDFLAPLLTVATNKSATIV